VFDIGDDVALEKIQKSFQFENAPQRFRLSTSSRAMIINNAPLALQIEESTLELLGESLRMEVSAKVWHFGALSISLHLHIPENYRWDQLVDASVFLETDLRLHQRAESYCKQIIQKFDASRIQKMNWETYEDYMLFFFKHLPGAEENAAHVFNKYDVPALILSQKNGNLSDQVKKNIFESSTQFAQNDLAVLNWDSAMVIEPSGSFDIPDVIEFALCQQLEMRYYDDLLDDKLASLYTALENKQWSLWENTAEKLSKEASQRYLEVSETIENVENSLKVVGDFYYAQIFRTALHRFRFNDWKASVDNKLENLATISNLLTRKINERRSHLLEIVIIVLIAIEVVPFLYGLIK
jgi:hypothetical protein